MDYKGDSVYIGQILAGNINAFGKIVDHHRNRVYNLALRICGNAGDAEEVAQDSFMKAFKSLGGFKMKSSFETWMYRIVYNTAVSNVRTRKKEILSIEDFPADAVDFIAENPSEQRADAEYRKALVSFLLQKISEDERAVITLFYYEEMSVEEIAEITGISLSNIKVKLFRARQKMLDIIEKEEKKKLVYHG